MSIVSYYPVPDVPVSVPVREEIKTVSIDVGIANFAIRIEKRWRSTGMMETVFMDKKNFTSKGCTIVTVLSKITEYLKTLFPYMDDTAFVVVEAQMRINYKCTRVYQHVMTYFSLYASYLGEGCQILEISPKMKGKMLNAGKLNYSELKKWSVETGENIMKVRGDEAGLRLIKLHKKKDDLSDTILQVEALFLILGLL